MIFLSSCGKGTTQKWPKWFVGKPCERSKSGCKSNVWILPGQFFHQLDSIFGGEFWTIKTRGTALKWKDSLKDMDKSRQVSNDMCDLYINIYIYVYELWFKMCNTESMILYLILKHIISYNNIRICILYSILLCKIVVYDPIYIVNSKTILCAELCDIRPYFYRIIITLYHIKIQCY